MAQKITSNDRVLHRKFVHYGANAKEWMRKCVLLLPQIAEQRIWEKKGFQSIYEYAAKLAGMSRHTVDDALWILRKIQDKPALQKIVEHKGLGAVRPVVTIATQENEVFWAEKAKIMSKHTLQTYVQELKKSDRTILQKEEISSSFLFPPGTKKIPQSSHQQAISIFDDLDESKRQSQVEENTHFKKILAMQLEPEIVEQLEKLKGEGDWNDLMKKLLNLKTQELQQEKPETVSTESRHIPAHILQHILERSNKVCEFPACKRPYEILHHTQRFALEKVHDPDRLVALCKAHERIVHHSLIENEDLPMNSWKVRTQPDFTHPKFAIDQLVQKRRMVKG